MSIYHFFGGLKYITFLLIHKVTKSRVFAMLGLSTKYIRASRILFFLVDK